MRHRPAQFLFTWMVYPLVLAIILLVGYTILRVAAWRSVRIGLPDAGQTALYELRGQSVIDWTATSPGSPGEIVGGMGLSPKSAGLLVPRPTRETITWRQTVEVTLVEPGAEAHWQVVDMDLRIRSERSGGKPVDAVMEIGPEKATARVNGKNVQRREVLEDLKRAVAGVQVVRFKSPMHVVEMSRDEGSEALASAGILDEALGFNPRALTIVMATLPLLRPGLSLRGLGGQAVLELPMNAEMVPRACKLRVNHKVLKVNGSSDGGEDVSISIQGSVEDKQMTNRLPDATHSYLLNLVVQGEYVWDNTKRQIENGEFSQDWNLVDNITPAVGPAYQKTTKIRVKVEAKAL